MNSRDSPEPVPYRDMWGKTIRPISQMKKLRPRGSPRSHSRSSWLDPACLIMPRLTLEDELLAHDPFRGSPSGRSLLPRKLLGGEGGEWGMESLTPGGLAPLNGRSTASPPPPALPSILPTHLPSTLGVPLLCPFTLPPLPRASVKGTGLLGLVLSPPSQESGV